MDKCKLVNSHLVASNFALVLHLQKNPCHSCEGGEAALRHHLSTVRQTCHPATSSSFLPVHEPFGGRRRQEYRWVLATNTCRACLMYFIAFHSKCSRRTMRIRVIKEILTAEDVFLCASVWLRPRQCLGVILFCERSLLKV